MEKAVIGSSQDLAAEYGVRCDAPFCLAEHMGDYDFYSVEGYSTLQTARDAALQGGYAGGQIETLG